MLTINYCADSAFIIRILTQVVKIIRWVIPIILILFITLDLFKVMASSPDDKTKKEAGEKIAKRVIYALIIFFVPTIVNFIFSSFGKVLSSDSNTDTTPTSWFDCWTRIYEDSSYGTRQTSRNTYTNQSQVNIVPTPVAPTPTDYSYNSNSYNQSYYEPPAPSYTPNPTYNCCYYNVDGYVYTQTQDKSGCDILRGFNGNESLCMALNDSST